MPRYSSSRGMRIFPSSVQCVIIALLIPPLRYSRFLVRQLDLSPSESSEDDLHFLAELRLTPYEAATIARFANPDRKARKNGIPKLSSVDSAMTGMFKRVAPFKEGRAEAEASFSSSGFFAQLSFQSEDFFRILVTLLAVSAAAMLLRGASLWTVLLLLLALSSFWQWNLMYKRALSNKHATLMQDAPPECHPDRMTWAHRLYNRVLGPSGDRCAEYHEALMVDPHWEVSPSAAVADTVAQFVLSPLGHLGTHLGEFFSNVLAEQSWLSAAPVLAVVSALLFLALMMGCGYRLRLPLFLGAFEPTPRHRATPPRPVHPPPPPVSSVEDLRSELESLQRVIQEQRRALLAFDEADRAKDHEEEEKKMPRLMMEEEKDGRDSEARLEEVPKLEEEAAKQAEKKVVEKKRDAQPQEVPQEDQAVDQQEARNSTIERVESSSEKEVDKEDAEGREAHNSTIERILKEHEEGPSLSTPRKRLVVRGSLSSPRETDFEWVEESEEEEDDDDQGDHAGGEAKQQEEEIVSHSGFLNKIETVFQTRGDDA